MMKLSLMRQIEAKKYYLDLYAGLFSPQCRNLTVNFGLVPTVRSIKGRREASFFCYANWSVSKRQILVLIEAILRWLDFPIQFCLP